MRQYQNSEELLFLLARYHLLGQEDCGERIGRELEKKIDAVINRGIYTKYKHAETTEEKEHARQEYLDRKGVPSDFRW